MVSGPRWSRACGGRPAGLQVALGHPEVFLDLEKLVVGADHDPSWVCARILVTVGEQSPGAAP